MEMTFHQELTVQLESDHWRITLPEESPDPICTVIKLELTGK